VNKINLSVYKNSNQYFIFYDIKIKEIYSNKEYYQESKDISPSSYRRAKQKPSKKGVEILKKLNDEFSLKMINEKIIDKIEKKLNIIYNNIYYKKDNCYIDDMNWIDDYLEKKYIIMPILLLFKLLLLTSQNSNPKKIIHENRELYKTVKKYEKFYNSDLLELLEIIDITFTEEMSVAVLTKTYKNELSYFTLSSKCLLEKKYIESIFFAEKCKKEFIHKENAKRIYYINLNLMTIYNHLHRYEECYMLSKNQMIALESYEYKGFEYETALKHHVIACLGLKKFNEIDELLKNKKELNITETICLLISLFNVDKKEYNETYFNLTNKLQNGKFKEILLILNEILLKKDYKAIEKLENQKINVVLLDIIKM